MSIERVAIIGAGIAGLSAAHHLAATHDVTVYDKEERLGGHACTIDVPSSRDAQMHAAIDVGFIVYNGRNYPNLTALFDLLGVETAATSMSLAVSLDGGGYEYSGSGLGGLFGQPGNIVNLKHWAMLRDLQRFFREAPALAIHASGTDDQTPHAGAVSLGAWLDRNGYSRAFIENHILPMGAAIWSTPSASMLDFPAAAFARFLANHGLLQVRNRPRWRTVVGGSQHYVAALEAATPATWRLGTGVAAVERHDAGVDVIDADGHRAAFDAVVLATHGDVARALLSDADQHEDRVLGAFRTTANEAVLHRDPGLMPKRRRLWSSWNYVAAQTDDALSVSYWMNALQPLATDDDWFVTLNPSAALDPATVAARKAWRHPVFDGPAIAAQSELWTLQGQRRTWFCGSYFGYGFHEDALQAGLAAAEDLSGRPRLWSHADQNDRLHLPPGWKPGLRLASFAPQADTPSSVDAEPACDNENQSFSQSVAP
ncbi:MAG: FAD-dependent oxidoreductase [Pseudomonadota bacterium]